MVVNILNFLHLNNVQMDQIQIGFLKRKKIDFL